MKKLLYFALILVLVAGIAMFGAMAPVPAEPTETRYADAPLIAPYASEVIDYDTKEYTTVKTAGAAPYYVQIAEISNACGAVAGSQIVGFYDKYYPNLIPGWESYYTSNGNYRRQDTTYVPALMLELYNLMQINVKAPGVSEDEFKTGLQTYFTNHGYTASFGSVTSGGALNFSACKAALSSNQLLVLFTTPGDVYQISEIANRDTLNPNTIAGNHIMIAYGYVEVYYYNSTGLFRADNYLLVATGWDYPSTAYYKANSTNLQAAYVVNVA